MPNYFRKALECFQHPMLPYPHHSPHKWLASTYGAKVQYPPNTTTAPKYDKRDITRVQSIAVTFLYIVRAVDPTMIIALNKMGAEQASTTTDTVHKTKMLMEYAATQPDAVIWFEARDMCLHINSDATYLPQPKARSRAAGHYYLSDNPPSPHIRTTPTPNGPILTKYQTIRTVMASAAEAKAGTILLNGQQAVPIRTSLIERDHPQPPTQIKTDSATSYGIITGNMRRKRSKAFDMLLYWMRCHIKHNQFRLYWQKGTENLADYFTKHFPLKHHRRVRYVYL